MKEVCVPVFAVLLLLVGCRAGPEEDFISGKSFDPCGQVIPACTGLFAGCVLDEARFTRVTFPGEVRFLVETGQDQLIDVMIFLSEPRDAGVNTEVLWHEPGCSDVYQASLDGAILFEQSEATSTFTFTENVLEAGEHLIEVFSDMQADVIIGTQVRIDTR